MKWGCGFLGCHKRSALHLIFEVLLKQKHAAQCTENVYCALGAYELCTKDVNMKVFLSWSGDRSHEVAKLLNEWLSCVIQSSKPWISSKDIDRGALWFTQINDQLQDTSIGIICLTQENKEKPWILFEAGALAKGLSSSRVCTLLIDLEPKDISDPLAQLNHTMPTKESMLALVQTLNKTMSSNSLDHRILEQVFHTYWSQFETKFKEILKTQPSSPPKPRVKEDVLAEILENTRSLNSRIRRLENEIEHDPIRDAFFRETRHPARRKIIEKQIQSMIKEGASEELIVRHFNSELPFRELEEIISMNKHKYSSNS